MASNTRAPRHPDQTIVGVVFTADGLDLGQASARAWQLWTERLDPLEMRGAALYDAALVVAGGHHVFVIAISGAPAIIQYVRDAFAAPDLLAFPGVAPITHRFMDAQAMPREQLAIRGYINTQGRFLPTQPDAQHGGWLASAPPIRHPTIPVTPASASLERGATTVLESTPLDGATSINLRLWRPSYTQKPRDDQFRRQLFAILGTVLILGTVIFIAFRLAGKTEGQSGAPNGTTPATPANGPQMVVAPLTLRAACTPGLLGVFTISNNGTKPLTWSSNAAQFEPPLSMSALNGTIAPGNAQTVQFTTSEVVKAQQVDGINVTSNGGNVRIAITVGGC